MAETHPSMIEQLRMKQDQRASVSESAEVMLISSAGYGVLDNGCGRTIIGRDTFKESVQLWGQVIPPPVDKVQIH